MAFIPLSLIPSSFFCELPIRVFLSKFPSFIVEFSNAGIPIDDSSLIVRWNTKMIEVGDVNSDWSIK